MSAEKSLEALIVDLRGNNIPATNAAVEALADSGNPQAAQALVEAFQLYYDTYYYNRHSVGPIRDALLKLGSVGWTALLDGLKHSHYGVRCEVVCTLGESENSPQAVEALIDVLEHDSSQKVRYWAAKVLGELADERSLRPLTTALREGNNQGLQQASTKALTRLGEAAVEPLINLLKAEDWYARACAVTALDDLGDARAVEPLIALLHDPVQSVRSRTLDALGRLGDARAVNPMIEIIKSSPEPPMRYDASHAIADLGEAALEPLFELLQDDHSARYAAMALGWMGDTRAVEALIAALHHHEMEVRVSAADALGKLKDLRALEPLTKRLQDSVTNVRLRAAGALGELGDARALPALLATVQDGQYWGNFNYTALKQIGTLEGLAAAMKSSDDGTRCHTLELMGEMDDPQTIPFLAAAFYDSDSDARNIAARTLVKFGERSLDTLLGLLKSDSLQVRQLAIATLARIKHERSALALIQLLDDEDDNIRHAVVRALGALGDERAVQPLLAAFHREENRGERADMISALGGMGAAAIPGLKLLLHHEDKLFRRRAINALGDTRHVQAVPPLISALDDAASGTQSLVLMALKRIGVEAVPALLDYLQNGLADIRCEVMATLGILGDSRAVEPLIALLKDFSPCSEIPSEERMCDAAATALTQIGTPAALKAVNDWR